MSYQGILIYLFVAWAILSVIFYTFIATEKTLDDKPRAIKARVWTIFCSVIWPPLLPILLVTAVPAGLILTRPIFGWGKSRKPCSDCGKVFPVNKLKPWYPWDICPMQSDAWTYEVLVCKKCQVGEVHQRRMSKDAEDAREELNKPRDEKEEAFLADLVKHAVDDDEVVPEEVQQACIDECEMCEDYTNVYSYKGAGGLGATYMCEACYRKAYKKDFHREFEGTFIGQQTFEEIFRHA